MILKAVGPVASLCSFTLRKSGSRMWSSAKHNRSRHRFWAAKITAVGNASLAASLAHFLNREGARDAQEDAFPTGLKDGTTGAGEVLVNTSPVNVDQVVEVDIFNSQFTTECAVIRASSERSIKKYGSSSALSSCPTTNGNMNVFKQSSACYSNFY